MHKRIQPQTAKEINNAFNTQPDLDALSEISVNGYRRQSPLVRKWLRTYGIDASDVNGDPGHTRLTKKDLERHMAAIGDAILQRAFS